MKKISDYKDLFSIPTAKDKLLLFHNILETKEDMTAHLALALLKTIHKELSEPNVKDRSVYKYYAEQIEALRFNAPMALQQVVSSWHLQKTTAEKG